MPPRHQRAHGALAVAFKQRDGATVLARLRQEGCLKLRLPRVERGDWPCAVVLNASGGVAAGDRLDLAATVAAGGRATLAAQAAERFYRALDGEVAAVTTAVQLGAGAALEWLPQETILFDGSAVRRRLAVEMAPDAWFLGVESLVLGRRAMGERLRRAELDDLIELTRGGQLRLHDRVRLAGDVATQLGARAAAAGAAAAGTIVLAAPDAEAFLEPVRAALAPFEAGVSAWDGMLLARVIAADGACLRRAVVAGLAVLRGGRALPRVWHC